MKKITKGHPLTQSPDFIKNNIETLKTLFPTIVKEGKIDFEELRALLDENLETEDEYYRFTWAGKSMARREATKPSTATLRPCKEESKNWDTTQNIFIEGDNLEVLKLLQKSYANKIKMIYIDPPYNTGKDFVYKDNYSDNLGNYLELTGQVDAAGRKISTNTESDGRYHSNWLNMMYPRLILARNLLTENGLIFISIDDKELANLKNVCDEVFGENNYLNILIWNLKSGTQAGHFTRSNESILVYSRNKSLLPFFGDNAGGTIRHGALKKISRVNPASEIEFPSGMEIEDNPDGCFSGVIGGSEKQFIISEEMRFINGKLEKPTLIKAGWAMKDQIESWLSGEETYDSKGQKVIRFFFNSQGILWYEKERGTFHPKTVLPEQEVGTTKNGTNELNGLFGKKIFDFPKPTSLLKYLVEFVTASDKECIILDFFAGTCTTAHAVMQLNTEDGGKRKFICIQLPEPIDKTSEAYRAGFKNIAEIGKERIRKSGEIILTEKMKEFNQLRTEIDEEMFQEEALIQMSELQQIIDSMDIGFKVFKLDSSNIVAWDGDPDKLEQTLFNAASNIKENRTEDDILYEILLKYGLELVQPIEQKVISDKTVFNIGGGALFICLADDITTNVADGIGNWKEELKPATCKVIFKDTGFTDVEKTNSMQILKRYGIEEVNTI